MDETLHISSSLCALRSHVPIPGIGLLPVHAYVLKSGSPVLIDTGLRADSDAFLEALGTVIDPRDLRWIWLTHTDQDHVGSLLRLLDEAPRARLVSNFLGAGKLGLFASIPPERLHLLDPGQSIDAGDRRLTAVTPPLYDAPETMGLHDEKSGTFFSSDCFGAPLESPVDRADAIAHEALRERQVLWATIDTPWIRHTSDDWLTGVQQEFRRIAPTAILSSHLPPASSSLTESFLESLAAARNASPFPGTAPSAFEEARAAAVAA